MCAELDRRRRVTLGFERIEALLDALGHPERDLRGVVQVVGTNGKGTTALVLAVVMEEMGHPAGAYLSPHVLSYTERVVLRGQRVSEDEFAAAMGATIDLADQHDIPVSQFEILTAGALKLFADAGVSWAVLEAGLGARYDATSVVEPRAVVLTNVDLDHIEYLGETVEEIAAEKLASLRPGGTLLLGTDDERVLDIASRECRRLGARLVRAGNAGKQDVSSSSRVPYAAHGVRLAAAAAETLLDRKLPPAVEVDVEENAAFVIRESLPGRFEAHEVEGVPVVVDGGHNVAGLSAALSAARSVYGGRPLIVVFGVLRDKDAAGMLAGLRREAHVILLTRPESERASEPALIERDYRPLDRRGRRAQVVEDPVDAIGAAIDEAREAGGVVLVAGSLATGAPILRWLHEA